MRKVVNIIFKRTQSLVSSSASSLRSLVLSSSKAKLATLNAESSSSPTIVGASSRVSALLKISSISHYNKQVSQQKHELPNLWENVKKCSMCILNELFVTKEKQDMYVFKCALKNSFKKNVKTYEAFLQHFS